MKGFTLIELLVVIGIVVILMTAALVAINPFRQFAMANNANRSSGVTTVMNAVYQNVVDNRGAFTCAAGDIPATAKCMGDSTAATPPDECSGGYYDICDCLVPTYVGTMPIDPQSGSYSACTAAATDEYDTRYTIQRDATTGRITICAPYTQIPPETAAICITR
jgi:prepilin-type N-terminal cleavage/methylation domain-containing protein